MKNCEKVIFFNNKQKNKTKQRFRVQFITLRNNGHFSEKKKINVRIVQGKKEEKTAKRTNKKKNNK